MPDAEVIEAKALVRPECLPHSREPAIGDSARAATLPPGMVAVMLSTTFATFMTLTGSYTLLF